MLWFELGVATLNSSSPCNVVVDVVADVKANTATSQFGITTLSCCLFVLCCDFECKYHDIDMVSLPF